MPVVPTPAKATVATETKAYVRSSSTVAITAARPGVVAGSSASSLVATAVSHPQ